MLIATTSAKGAPGTTTAARVLASVWSPAAVLADLDPVGGDLVFHARGADGAALDPDRGLLSLAAEARRGVASSLEPHLQTVEGGLEVLCGVSGPEQMSAVAPVMATVAAALRSGGTDVVADCGRLTPGSPALPVVLAADVVLVVVRPQVEAFAHLRERLRWLSSVPAPSGRPPSLGAVVVTAAADQRSAKDLARLLAHADLPVPVVGRLAHDPRTADVVAGRLQRRIDRSLLVRSARELVAPVRALASGPAIVPTR